MSRPRSELAALAMLAASGCGAAAVPSVTPSSRASPPAQTLRGRVMFEARVPTPRGASARLEIRPARYVELQARDSAGARVGSASTDADGGFEMEVPGTAVGLDVVARLRHEGFELWVSRDPLGTQPQRMRVPLAGAGSDLLVVAREAGEAGFSGALHILDTMLRGEVATREWTGRSLPPLFAYWGRGVTTVWSYYRGERPEGSGRYGIELMGGERGRLATTDTDEHDEAIVLHEFGHFVMDQLSTDSSPGGDHPTGHLIDPGLAWEEGRASWFATAVLGRSVYRDTIGIEPRGRLRIDHDLEHGSGGPRGIGSEQGVAEILWDLADGAGGLPDSDGDPVSLGPAAVLAAMMALRGVPGAYPAISTFLRFLIDRGDVSEAAAKQLLAQGGHPQRVLPGRGQSVWPIDISLPSQVGGKIDGLSEPAPSGGPNRPANGVDALRVYRVHLQRRARLSVRLRIGGSGAVAAHQDLDLELRDSRAALLDSSRGEGPVEAVSRQLEEGFYLIYVRDGGGGNRAAYELSVWAEPT